MLAVEKTILKEIKHFHHMTNQSHPQTQQPDPGS